MDRVHADTLRHHQKLYDLDMRRAAMQDHIDFLLEDLTEIIAELKLDPAYLTELVFHVQRGRHAEANDVLESVAEKLADRAMVAEGQ